MEFIVIGAIFLIGAFLVVSFNHAYRFTHFEEKEIEKTKTIEELGLFSKLKILFSGVKNPKPKNWDLPRRDFEKIRLIRTDKTKIHAWQIKIDDSKGVVLLFHGYSACKSTLLDEAEAFNQLGYDAFLVDFYGHGDSDGATTTIGYSEAGDVAVAFEYIKSKLETKQIILYGVSMGAVAVLRAVAEYKIEPHKIILECPYGSMLDTIRLRFKAFRLPSFPFAEILLLWGSLQNRFWGFSMDSVKYARKVQIPTLLFLGSQDVRVTLQETQKIYEALSGQKDLIIFEESKHESYLNKEREKWMQKVSGFLA